MRHPTSCAANLDVPYEIEAGRFEVVAATRSVTELKGMFGSPQRTVSIEEMNAAIASRGASAR